MVSTNGIFMAFASSVPLRWPRTELGERGVVMRLRAWRSFQISLTLEARGQKTFWHDTGNDDDDSDEVGSLFDGREAENPAVIR